MYRPLPAIEGTHLPNYIDVIAGESIQEGRFCILDDAGKAFYAQDIGKRAVGIAVETKDIDELVRIQVFGLYYSYTFSFTAQIGAIYYQTIDGYITNVPNLDLTYNYPVAQAVGSNTINLLLDTYIGVGGGPVVATDTSAQFEAVAASTMRKGTYVHVDYDGKVEKATKVGKKAVGIVLEDVYIGDIAKIQTSGIFTGFIYPTIPLLGEIYYQDDNGSITLPDDPLTVIYPAAIPVSNTALRILPDILGLYHASLPDAPAYVEPELYGIGVKRIVYIKTGLATVLTSLVSLDELVSNFFTNVWSTSEYMLKQYITIQNTSLDVDLVFTFDTINIEVVAPGTSITFPLYTTDWSLNLNGAYVVSIILEILSSDMKHVEVNISDIQSSWDVTRYRTEDNIEKAVQWAITRNFGILNSVADVTDTLIFDYPDWIASTINSGHYYVKVYGLFTNNSGTDNATITLDVDSQLTSIIISPTQSVAYDIYDERTKVLCTGSVNSEFVIQACAYEYK